MAEIILDFETGPEGADIAGVTKQGTSTAKYAAVAKQRGNFGAEFSAAANSYSFYRAIQDVEADSAATVFDFIAPLTPSSTDKTVVAFRAGPAGTPASLAVNAAITPAGKIRAQASGVTVVNPFPTATTGDNVLIPGQSYRLQYMVSGRSTTAGRVDARLIRKSTGAVIGTVQSLTANTKDLPIMGADFGVSPTTDEAWQLRIDDARFIPNHSVGPANAPTWPGEYVPSTGALTITVVVVPNSGTVPFTVTATINVTGGTGTAKTYSYNWGDGSAITTGASNTATHVYSTASPTRTVTDGVLNTTTTLTSASATFTSADVGRLVTGAGIPTGTVITSVTNGSTAVMSGAATLSGTGRSVTVSGWVVTATATEA